MALFRATWSLLFPTPQIFVDCAACWVLLAFNFGVIGQRLEPYKRQFSGTDPLLSQPHRGAETVSDTHLIFVILVVPLGVFAANQIYCRNLMDMRIAFLTVCEGITVASTFARWMKLTGRLRPDFLARYATGDPHLIGDGRMSFPSEHTTYSFASMMIVFWYMVGKTHIWESTQSRYVNFSASIFCLLPIMAAVYIGLTRTMDNVHHFSDVVAGAMVGSFCGTFAYFLNFPQPFHPQCHFPKIMLKQKQDERVR